MNIHNQINEILTAFALGELNTEQTNSVEKHLADCIICRTELAQIQTLLKTTEAIGKLTADDELEQAARSDVFEAAAKTKQTPALKILWRQIMKSPITKIAAAAVIIIATILGIHYYGGSIDGTTVAWAQMTENMKKTKWMHGTINTLGESLECWISFESRVVASKSSSGQMTFRNDNTYISHVYNADSNTITISHTAENVFEGLGVSPLNFCELVTKYFSESGGNITQKTGQYNGKTVTIHEMKGNISGTNMAITMMVDTKQNLPVFINQKIFNSDGNLTGEANATFDYPETGPKDIYDLGVPREAQVAAVKSTTLLKGRLVNKDRQPIEGIVTSMYGDIQTDKQGVFTISDSEWKPDSLNSQVGYAFNKEKKLSRGFFWKKNDDVNVLEIILEPPADISGRIIDRNGNTLKEAEVQLEISMPEGGFWVSDKNPWNTKMESDGRFCFEAVPVGLPLKVFADKPGFQGSKNIEELKPGTTIDVGDILLNPLPGFESETEWNGKLSGRVTDENGKPMPSLRVWCAVGTKIFEDTTDLKGQYKLTGLPKNKKVNGAIYAEGYGHTMFQTIVDGNELNIQIFPQGWNLLNKPAPGFFVEKWLNTEPLTLEQLKGNVVILMLGVYIGTDIRFAPNIQYLDDTQKLYNKYRDNGLVVIAVHRRTEITKQQLLDYIEKNKIGYPFAIDADTEKIPKELRDNIKQILSNGAMYSIYDVKAVPATYLIDKKGILRISPGPKIEDIEKWVKKLLAE